MLNFVSVVILLCFSVGFAAADPDPDCFRNRPRITPMECCTLPNLVDPETMQECREEFNAESIESDIVLPPPPPPSGTSGPGGSGPRGGPHPGHAGHHRCWHCFTCSHECAFNATGLLKDGELDAEVALQHFVQMVEKSDPKWPKEIMEDAFSACNDKVKIMREKFSKRAPPRRPPNYTGPECSPIPQHLLHCIHGQLYRLCPDGVRNPSEECTELQEYLGKCHGPLEWKKAPKPHE